MTSAAPDFRLVPLALIDEPVLVSREEMDDHKLEALIKSIRAIGLQQPIVVKPHGDRFEVVAGHRRTIACRAVGLDRVPALVTRDNGVNPEAIKAHENLFREDLTAAEEAAFVLELLETQAGGDVDRLVELLHVSRPWIDQRLELLRGAPEILTAVRAREINFSVARHLNRFPPEWRVHFLQAAISGGANARVVSQWYADWKARQDATPASELTPATTNGGVGVLVSASALACYLCGSDEDPHEIEYVAMHRSCKRAAERQAHGAAAREARHA